MPYLLCMETTTHQEPTTMNRKNVSIDDLAAAIEWLNSYDRGDEQDELADSLAAVVGYLANDIADRYASRLERNFKADIKKDGKALTAAGKIQLRDLSREKGAAFAANIVADCDRGSLVYTD